MLQNYTYFTSLSLPNGYKYLQRVKHKPWLFAVHCIGIDYEP